MVKKSKYKTKHNRGIYFTFFGIVIGLVILVAISSYFLYQREKEQTAQELSLQAEKSLDIMEQFISNEFNFVGKDLIYLSKNPAFTWYINEDQESSRVVIEKTLASFGKIRDHYHKIRLLDTLGNEVLKIDFAQGSAQINNNLQDKSHRYYFQESKNLREGEIYISALDLNEENGEIRQPSTSVLRFVSPFYSSEGKKMGSIVISYKANRILERIPLIEDKSSLVFTIVDSKGDWLVAPPLQYYSNDTEAQLKDRNFSISFPQEWKLMQEEPEGKSLNAMGFSYYRTLDCSPFFDGLIVTETSSIHWKMISSFPKGHLSQLLWGIRRDLMLYGLLMLGLIIPTIALLFQNLLEKNHRINRIAEDLENTNRSLFQNELELQHNLTQMEELTQEKEEIIEELEVKEKELIVARDSAEEATKAKSNFLATMSHEIRTPLNAVLGMTDLLSRSHLNDDQMDLVKTIQISGDALLTVINDVLDFSRIQSGKMIIDSHPFTIEKVVNETFEIVANKIGNKEIELVYDIEKGIPTVVLGDEARLRQVLLNLVGNAVKFTEAGHVLVRISANSSKEGLPGNFLFSVEDTGMGVPEDKQNLLFQPFNQIDSSITHKHGGSGLGLAISRKLVNNMGGEFKLKSSPNKGSCFQFSVYLEPQVLQPESELNDKLKDKKIGLGSMSRLQESVLTQLFQRNNIQILNEKLSQAEILLWEYDRRDSIPIGLAETLKIIYLNCPKDLPSKSNAKELFLPKPLDQRALLQYIVSFEKNAPITKEAIAKSNAELSNDKVKILIAEDNAINMKLIVMILEKMGYQAVCVENGLKAIGAFEKELFDIVLMDIQMPEMDGIEASKRIRIWFGNRPVIIALTANAMEGDKELYLKEGMDDYIAKPIQFELLQKKLTHWVKESRIRNGLSQ